MTIYRLVRDRILSVLVIILVICVSSTVHAEFFHVYVNFHTDCQLCEGLETGEFLAMFQESSLIYEYYKSLSDETPQIKMQKMEEYFTQQLQENPSSEGWNVASSILYLYHNKPEKAYVCLKKVCDEFRTEAAQAWFMLACLEREYLGNKEAAYPYINRAVELDSEDFLSLMVRGAFLEQDGKYTESIADFTLCNEIVDDIPAFHAYRAVNYIHLEEYSKAVADLEYSLEGDWKYNPNCYLYLLGCYLILNQNDKAIELLNRATLQFPREPSFPLLYYLIQDRKGETDLPEKLFTPGIRVNFPIAKISQTLEIPVKVTFEFEIITKEDE